MNIGALNACDRASFVNVLGAIFEDSPWVVDSAWYRRPFAAVDDLMAAILAVVETASNDEKLALIRTHPDLAGKAARAGALTEYSASEQAGVGLDRLSDEEYARFHRLNDAYKARFGFPFVIAVRGHNRETLLAAFATRLQNDQGSEMAEALHNIGLIAQFRLEDMLAG